MEKSSLGREQEPLGDKVPRRGLRVGRSCCLGLGCVGAEWSRLLPRPLCLTRWDTWLSVCCTGLELPGAACLSHWHARPQPVTGSPKCQRPAPRNAQEVGVTGQQGNVEPASRVVSTAGERQQCPPQGRDLSSRGCQVGTEFRASLERAGDKTVGPTSARAPQHSCLKGDPRLRAFAGCTGPEPRGPESSFANNSKSCPYPTAQEPPILKGPAPRQGAGVWVSSSVGAGCLEATPVHLRLLDKPRRGGAA